MPDQKMIYKIGTLAQKTGLSPNLIRAWEQRYGFLSPKRGSGKHRLFGEEDLLILLYLRKELDTGRRIGELAIQGRANLLHNAKVYQRTQHYFSNGEEVKSHLENETIIEKYVHRLVEAAESVDLKVLNQALHLAISSLPPGSVINKIITPAMIEIGKGWKEGRISIAGEHMASCVFEQKIVSLLEASQLYSQKSPLNHTALCACFPGENHKLGIVAIAYYLASQGFSVVFLGNALPFRDLEYAIASVNPSSVWLSVTRPSLYRRHVKEFVDLVNRNQSVHFIIGGQAVTTENKALRGAGCEQCLQSFILPDDLMTLPLFSARSR
jgi:methanogenic corrinoid protein MtbC1